MIVGVPKEIKKDEYRIAMVPAGVEAMTRSGHKVLVERNAGMGSGITDKEYMSAGAEIMKTPKEIFSRADMIVKVKEPLPAEFPLMREGQVVFTYFHFAADRKLLEATLRRGIVGIAYETIQLTNGVLPLLTPMSEVAGRIAVQEGAKYLERPFEGRGILLAGVPGVAPAKVVVIGGGIVGTNSAKMAAGLGARVTIMDTNLDRLRYLDDIMDKNVVTLMSNAHNIRNEIKDADLVIGAVLIPGAKAPKLITKDMLKLMPPRSVLVDVSIDQGGFAETSKPTTHSKPTFIVNDVIHYCVANMPGAVGRTSTHALTNATLPYALALANKGYRRALQDDPALAKGLNVCFGKVTHQAVADAFDHECHSPVDAAEEAVCS